MLTRFSDRRRPAGCLPLLVVEYLPLSSRRGSVRRPADAWIPAPAGGGEAGKKSSSRCDASVVASGAGRRFSAMMTPCRGPPARFRRAGRPHAVLHRRCGQLLPADRGVLTRIWCRNAKSTALSASFSGLRILAQPGSPDRLGDGLAFILGNPAVPILAAFPPASGRRDSRRRRRGSRVVFSGPTADSSSPVRSPGLVLPASPRRSPLRSRSTSAVRRETFRSPIAGMPLISQVRYLPSSLPIRFDFVTELGELPGRIMSKGRSKNLRRSMIGRNLTAFHFTLDLIEGQVRHDAVDMAIGQSASPARDDLSAAIHRPPGGFRHARLA